MNRMIKRAAQKAQGLSKKVVTGVVAGAVVIGSQASAAGLTVPTSIDLSDFMAVAGIVVIASAAMWGVRKAIGLIH
jgi:hypothetical protein